MTTHVGSNRWPARKSGALTLGLLLFPLWSECTVASNHLDTRAVIANPRRTSGTSTLGVHPMGDA